VRYFNRPAEVEFTDGSAINYWDGAVGGYNNPIMAGVIEALAADPARRETMQVLSIGTAGTRLPVVAPDWPGNVPWVVRRKRLSGLDSVRVVSDLRKLTAAIMADRPEAAGYMAHIALGEPVATPEAAAVRRSRIVRLNPMIQPRHAGETAGHAVWEPHGWFEEPSSVRGKTLFERLVALDMDAVADEEVRDIERLADLWLEGRVPNQPVYSDDRFAPVIGHGWFAEALAAWRALDAAAPEPTAATEVPRESGLGAAARRFLGWLGRRRTRDGATSGPLAAPAPAASATLPSTAVVPGRAPVD